MLQILKYLKDYLFWAVLILILLVAQAFCDLSLPDYTSKLVDTGISAGGVTDTVPKILTASEYEGIRTFMTADEQALVTQSYKQTDKLSDSGYQVKTQTAGAVYYVLTAQGEKQESKLKAAFAEPILLYSQFSAMDETDLAKMLSDGKSTDIETLAAQMGVEKSGEQYTIFDFISAKVITPAQLRASAESEYATLMDNYADSMVAAFLAESYKAMGIDTRAIQNHYLLVVGAQMLGLALLLTAISITVGFLAARVSADLGMKTRDKVFHKVVRFSNAEMDRFSTASLITRSTNDIQQVQMVAVMLLRMVAYAPVMGVGGLIKVLNTNTSMAWIIGIAVLAVGCVVSVLMVVAMPKFKMMQQLMDRVNLVMREVLTGLPVIRAFRRGNYEEKRFDEANTNLTKTMLFTNRAMTFMFPLMMLIMNGITLLIVWVGGHKIEDGSLQLGEMIAFIQYTMMIVMSFLMITMISIMLPRAAVSANRIEEVLKVEPEITDKENARDTQIQTGKITFSHVNFRYPNAQEDVLHDINFSAEPGQTTAIIGSTGCGKSTLVHLILRLYDVTGGQIFLDGTDIRDVTQHSLRAAIGFVPQKATLFSGTIRSNLQFGDENAPEAWLEKSAEIAQAKEFIDQKPERLDSEISQGGTNVSGGQKQRLAIARAVAKKPPVYIFDDSFSALDYQTDVALRRALSENAKESTVLIVAQRIVTILNADRILVLDNGRIQGIGTHRELMQSCEVYQQIVKSQLSESEIEKSMGKEAGANV